MNRTYKDSPDYEEVYYFSCGIGTTTPLVTDTSMEIPIPIENGTVNDDGDNQLTGSNGGDNTTDNAVTYKQGAGASDAKAQNLITNGTSATKTWTIANLAANGTNIDGTQYICAWLYIADATTLAYFKSAGTCLELKFGSDAANYYSKTWTQADITTGWNWLYSWNTAVEDLSETGTVAGNIDTFIIEITTNNAADSWNSGDVIYDLLRTYQDSDLYKAVTSFTFNETDNEVSSLGSLKSIQANGFLVSEYGLFNNDATKKMISHDVFTAKSKTTLEEIQFEQVDYVTTS